MTSNYTTKKDQDFAQQIRKFEAAYKQGTADRREVGRKEVSRRVVGVTETATQIITEYEITYQVEMESSDTAAARAMDVSVEQLDQMRSDLVIGLETAAVEAFKSLPAAVVLAVGNTIKGVIMFSLPAKAALAVMTMTEVIAAAEAHDWLQKYADYKDQGFTDQKAAWLATTEQDGDTWRPYNEAMASFGPGKGSVPRPFSADEARDAAAQCDPLIEAGKCGLEMGWDKMKCPLSLEAWSCLSSVEHAEWQTRFASHLKAGHDPSAALMLASKGDD